MEYQLVPVEFDFDSEGGFIFRDDLRFTVEILSLSFLRVWVSRFPFGEKVARIAVYQGNFFIEKIKISDTPPPPF